jgi:DNA-directed RNA polymerase subunit RPC12/RpoP
MIEEEKKKCDNCGAEYKVEHDLPEDDYKMIFCPFCSYEKEEDEFNNVEDRYYEDWD